MDAVIFVGLQGSGKSTFYERKFSGTHVRINLDALKTRYRETALLKSCIQSQQDFVIDNTNPTVHERSRYIAPARLGGFQVIGYLFHSRIQDCLRRNELRSGKAKVPPKALFGTLRKIELPSFEEGFNQLFYVNVEPSGDYIVVDWSERPQPEPARMPTSEQTFQSLQHLC